MGAGGGDATLTTGAGATLSEGNGVGGVESVLTATGDTLGPTFDSGSTRPCADAPQRTQVKQEHQYTTGVMRTSLASRRKTAGFVLLAALTGAGAGTAAVAAGLIECPPLLLTESSAEVPKLMGREGRPASTGAEGAYVKAAAAGDGTATSTLRLPTAGTS